MVWFADETFWKDLYPFMFGKERFRRADAELEDILAMTGVEKGRVLDLATGPGRHAVAAARKGFATTGVDKSPFLLEKAERLARKEGLDIEWIEADMRDFRREERFDLILNLFTSFGFFIEEADDLRVFENIHASLKPKGMFVMDIMGKEIIARGYRPTMSDELADGTILVRRHELVDSFKRIENEWLLIKGENVKTFTFPWRIYSAAELERLAERAGFTDVKTHGGYGKEPYDEDAQRLVLVARKPDGR